MNKIIAKNKEHLYHVINEHILTYGNQCNLNHIDTSQVTDFSSLFLFDSFNEDISQWNTSKVIDMSYMFEYSQFNGNISRWNFQSLNKHDGIFNGCYNHYIPDWVVLDENTQKFKDSINLNNDLEQLLNNQPSTSKKLKI